MATKEFFCPQIKYIVLHFYPLGFQKCMNELPVTHSLRPCAVNLFRNQLSGTLCNSWHFFFLAHTWGIEEKVSLWRRIFPNGTMVPKWIFLYRTPQARRKQVSFRQGGNEIDGSLKAAWEVLLIVIVNTIYCCLSIVWINFYFPSETMKFFRSQWTKTFAMEKLI